LTDATAAVHWTVSGVDATVTNLVPPTAGALHAVGESVTVPAAWVTVTDWPAIVAVAVRGAPLVVDAAVSVSVADPVPLAGVTVSHEGAAVVVHCTVAGLVVSVTDCVPPPAGAAQVLGVTVTVPPCCVTVTV
jgi:hypothetical protein